MEKFLCRNARTIHSFFLPRKVGALIRAERRRFYSRSNAKWPRREKNSSENRKSSSIPNLARYTFKHSRTHPERQRSQSLAKNHVLYPITHFSFTYRMRKFSTAETFSNSEREIFIFKLSHLDTHATPSRMQNENFLQHSLAASTQVKNLGRYVPPPRVRCWKLVMNVNCQAYFEIEPMLIICISASCLQRPISPMQNKTWRKWHKFVHNRILQLKLGFKFLLAC